MGDAEQKGTLFLRHLNAAIKGLSLYPAGHPSITKSVSDAFNAVSFLLGAADRVIIGLVQDVIVIDENPLYTETSSMKEFISRIKRLDVGTITIYRGVAEREIGGGLLRLLHSEPADIEMQGGFEAYLKALDAAHITVLEAKAQDDKTGAEAAKRVYKKAIQVVRESMEEVRLGRIPSSTGVKAVINEMVEQVLENKGAILGLSMIKGYDEYTFHHCVNVSILSLALAEALGMPQDVLKDIGAGAILHDIGKVDTYEGVIKKPGPLNEEEWKEVRKHPLRGAEILKNMEGISETSIKIVLEHHLKYNRKGYPDIQGMEGQSEPSMCVSIADCYDGHDYIKILPDALQSQ